MTTPDERARSVVQAGALLAEIALDQRLPVDVRRKAAHVARHYPTPAGCIAVTPTPFGYCLPLTDPDWVKGYRYGQLTDALSDRLSHLVYEFDD